MKITRKQITIAELINGYKEKGEDGIEGVVAYGGKLDVRPAYQREYVYSGKERDEVIRSVKKGFPLNIMYWSKVGDDHYELMDGQQRTISICRYAADDYQTYSVDHKYFFNVTDPIERQAFFDYTLDIYICEGTPSEIHEWFTIINIAGKVLSAQEILNTSYTGTWLSAAKLFFSKPHCTAYNMASDYMVGSPIRQQYLETVLKWISDRDGFADIEDYMALHQHDNNANDIINYFKNVIEWIERTFTNKRKSLMAGLPWGLMYNAHKDDNLDPVAIEKEIKMLLQDDDVSDQNGVYEYILTRNEKHLSIRAFDKREKRQVYELQNQKCADCGLHFEIEDMEAHHKIRWVDGGHTTIDNCVMLCKACHDKRHGE
ncbi:MAG: HNH endonuclease family protein [Christensenellales bacterium]